MSLLPQHHTHTHTYLLFNPPLMKRCADAISSSQPHQATLVLQVKFPSRRLRMSSSAMRRMLRTRVSSEYCFPPSTPYLKRLSVSTPESESLVLHSLPHSLILPYPHLASHIIYSLIGILIQANVSEPLSSSSSTTVQFTRATWNTLVN